MFRLKFINNARIVRVFTLIELLIVIAIISILASLLMPVLRMAMESTYSVHCLGNLRQIGAGIDLYASDYGNMLPTTWVEDSTIWQTKINPFLGVDHSYNGSNPLWWCKSAQKLGGGLRHYAVTSWYHASAEWNFRRDKVKNPAGIFLVGELNRDTESISGGTAGTYSGSESCRYRISHNGKKSSAFLFVDGHTEMFIGDMSISFDSVNKHYWRWW